MEERKDDRILNDNIGLDGRRLDENSSKARRVKNKKPINPIYGHIFRICGIIIILAYWINVYLNYKKNNDVKVSVAPKIQERDYQKVKAQPEQSYQQKTNYASNNNNIAKPVAYPSNTNQSNNIRAQETSPAGKVFSWIDKNGLTHYSNTIFPQDNPTLKVQTEIK